MRGVGNRALILPSPAATSQSQKLQRPSPGDEPAPRGAETTDSCFVRRGGDPDAPAAGGGGARGTTWVALAQGHLPRQRPAQMPGPPQPTRGAVLGVGSEVWGVGVVTGVGWGAEEQAGAAAGVGSGALAEHEADPAGAG